MKILYLTPTGKKVELADPASVDGHIVIDMDPVRKTIANEIRTRFDKIDIEDAAETFSAAEDITMATIGKYGMFLCDLTATNGNVLYLAGVADALQKPVIYIISSDASYPGVLERKRLLTYSNQSVSQDFFNELFSLIELAYSNPSSLLNAEVKRKSPSVFVSYSHQDKAYLDRLMVHLKPIAKKGLLDVWADTRIKTGDRWRESIVTALDNASIAILLISADFLSSDFIVADELPPLLSRAEVNGTRILPVVLSPCRFSRDESLNRFQSANSPTRPLSSMSHDERESVYDQLVLDIEKALPSAGTHLKNVLS